MDEIIYVRLGKKYRKIARDEKIAKGAMMTLADGELNPIMHEGTIGQLPSSFSEERNFFNPIED
jgi:hypothetical protein